MRSTAWSYVLYFSTHFILINLSNEVPLSGTNIRDVKPGELSFVVSIQDTIGHNCVGTLISQKSVLTAAHCLTGENINNLNIMVGSNDLRKGTIYKADSWISYEQWANMTNNLNIIIHDIAIITLKQRVTEVNAAAILTFVPQELHCQKVRIAGWGCHQNGTLPLILQTAVVKVISHKVCVAHIQSVLERPFYIPQTYFCSRADPWILGDCGDSGAPILNKHNQIVAIHLGICPLSLLNSNHSKEFINQNLVNLHLHLYGFRRFIKDVKQD